jgi:glyoxylase-like metal-dependent hydrolase (beta-lactamase superfamily II)
LGNNSTHGVIITSKGVVLIDSGASYLGAKEIHKTIRKLTNKPIKIVINTGGQDHK